MSGNTVPLHTVATVNTVANTARLFIVRDASSNTPTLRSIEAQMFLSNTQCNIKIANGYFLILSTNSTPANSSDTSNTTPVYACWSDGSYVYVKTSNTVVKRVALSTW